MSHLLRFLVVFWGFFWAAILEYTRWGQWLAFRRTWVTVVVGVGVNLFLLLPVLPRREWLHVAEVFALSSIGIIVRSLHHEHREDAQVR